MSTNNAARPSQIRLDNVQFSWPFIFEKDDSDKPKYRVDVLISKKDKKNLAKLQEAMKYAFLEGVKNPKMWNGKKPKKWHNPIHDGDEPRESGEEKGPEYKGKFHFTCSSQREVQVVDKTGKVLTSDDEFFGGCIGSIIINTAAYKERKIGIGIYVNAICKTDEGERFGGGGKVNIKTAFADLLEGEGFDFDSEDDEDDEDDDIFGKKKSSKKSTKKRPIDGDGSEDDEDDEDDEDEEDEDFNPFG